MKETIFTKIIKGEIPCTKIYEDDSVFAFLDIMPNNIGHTLVVPKESYPFIKDIPDELLSKVIIAVKKISIAVKKGMSAEGINLALNDGTVAGQEIPHFHFHVIPRFTNDGFKHGRHLKYDGDEHKEKVGEMIRKFL